MQETQTLRVKIKIVLALTDSSWCPLKPQLPPSALLQACFVLHAGLLVSLWTHKVIQASGTFHLVFPFSKNTFPCYLQALLPQITQVSTKTSSVLVVSLHSPASSMPWRVHSVDASLPASSILLLLFACLHFNNYMGTRIVYINAENSAWHRDNA